MSTQSTKPKINGSHATPTTTTIEEKKQPSSSPAQNTTSSNNTSQPFTKSNIDHTLDSLDFNLSSKVEAKLREVIPSSEPLDSSSFNVIEHINNLFPTEESLGDVHDGPLAFRISHIRTQVNNIDEQLSKSVQEAAENRRKTQTAIKETQISIQDLFTKVKSIKEKAVQSEIMVEEICSDIRKLDNAKKNLSESITTLQKLHMLVSGVEQLQKDASTKSYDRASHLVQALNDLFMHFKDHLSLTQLKSLKLDMDKTREELKKNIYRDFRKHQPKDAMDAEEMIETLMNACEVIDALGDEEKMEFIDWFCNTQLQAYGAIYAPGGEKSGIEYLDRRFEWLKNQLLKYNKHYARIFPRYWNVPGHVCKLWADITRKHLIEILSQSKAMNDLDMSDMVKALEQCVSFERELQRLYSMPSFSDDIERLNREIKELLGEYDEEDLYSEPMTADKIKKRYKLEALKKQLREAELLVRQENKQSEIEDKIEEITFNSILSSAFNKYMHYYIELERKSISNVLSDINKSEEWLCLDLAHIPNEARYGGIDDLLGYIKSSIHRCAKIGGADIFYKIYFEYKDGLIQYIEILNAKVNSINAEIGNKNKKSNSNANNTNLEIVSLVLIVNTLDYLSDTLSALENKLKSSMTSEKFAKKINLRDIQEGKSDDLAAKTVKCIAQQITEKIGFVMDKEVIQCRKWSDTEQATERSSFLSSVKSILNNDIAIAHELLTLSYHSLLNSQMSQRVIPRYISSTLGRIRRMSAEGALQLQLDTRDFQKTILNLPMIGLDEESAIAELNIHPNLNKKVRIPNAFKNSTSKQVNRIQAVLKTIVINYTTNSAKSLESIATFFKDVSNNGNRDDLSKICEIKGLSKDETRVVVNYYNNSCVHTSKQSKPLINNAKQRNDEVNIATFFRSMTAKGSVFARGNQ